MKFLNPFELRGWLQKDCILREFFRDFKEIWETRMEHCSWHSNHCASASHMRNIKILPLKSIQQARWAIQMDPTSSQRIYQAFNYGLFEKYNLIIKLI